MHKTNTKVKNIYKDRTVTVVAIYVIERYYRGTHPIFIMKI